MSFFNSRGDVNFDFSIALVLFMIVYAGLFSSLPSATTSFQKNRDALATSTVFLTESLVAAPGIPKNWTTFDENQKLGLAFYNSTFFPNVIDVDKALQLSLRNCSEWYNKTTVTLEFKIAVINNTASVFECNNTVPRTARITDRMAFLKNASAYTPVTLRVYTW